MTRLAPDLVGAARSAARAAREAGRAQWLAVPVATPGGDLLAYLTAAEAGERFFFARPAEELALAGLGCAHAFEAEGETRFSALSRRAEALRADLHAPPECAGLPLLLGGFGFGAQSPCDPDWADFPAARLVMPQVAVSRRAGEVRAAAYQRVEPGAAEASVLAEAARLAERWRRGLAAPSVREGPPAGAAELRATSEASPAAWCAAVRDAVAAIAAGDLEKVVLARALRLERAGGFDPIRALSALRAEHPTCASFAVARGASFFLGCTPERLVRLRGRAVETAAVAGSARRGRSPGEDARLARELRESKKEQAEHAIVVRALRAGLEPVCERIRAPEAPRLLRLPGIQHLETPFAGRLAPGVSLLDLVERLHPTPAVGGAPREAALAFLAAREGLERGWYAGPIGWLAADGSGEFCAALRSVLLRGDRARAFAGAGIVAGSRPEAEWTETRLKLRGALDALLEL